MVKKNRHDLMLKIVYLIHQNITQNIALKRKTAGMGAHKRDWKFGTMSNVSKTTTSVQFKVHANSKQAQLSYN